MVSTQEPTQVASKEKTDLMTEKQKCFFVGIFRLCLGSAAVGLVVLALILLGHFSITYKLIVWSEPNLGQIYTFTGRALVLMWIGFIQAVIGAMSVAVVGMVVLAAYYGVLHLGGYREEQEKSDAAV